MSRTIPPGFDSPEAEYAAATGSAALFDRSGRTLIELTGEDRVRFLHGFCTNDVKRLSAGQGCEAFITNVKGKIVGRVAIVVDRSAIWLDADAGSADRLVSHLARYVINEDVVIADRSADWAEVLVMGPDSGRRLGRIGIDVDGLSPFDHRPFELGRLAGRVQRCDVGLHRGYMFAIRAPGLEDIRSTFEPADILLAGSETWNALRIEAGLPIYGVDITDDHLAQEVGRTKSAISFTKGCYLGQEPIARLDAMGHVNRELRSLRLSGAALPQPGARVWADAAASQPAGTVTSAAFSYGSRSAVAMGLLRSSVAAPGTSVFVGAGPSLAAAEVFWFPAS